MTQRGRQRPGWNPSRRNRNIGTVKQGHGQDNRLVIPYRYGQYYEQIGRHVVLLRRIHGRVIRFVVERPRAGVSYAVTIDDVVRVLWMIPKADLDGLRLFVFRQPTRKQNLLRPVWGRVCFGAEIGKLAGPAIFLDAVDPDSPFSWPRDLKPDDVRELDRIRADGHRVRERRRRFFIEWNVESIRFTQLFRTLPHEVGHWVDWLRRVIRPAKGDFEKECNLSKWYFSRPDDERERFAHRYADEFQARLRRAGEIPFQRQFNLAKMREDRLRAVDFGIASTENDASESTDV